MALSHRVERIAEQIREELSQILATEVSDPGVGLVTITRVKVTADLSLARAYWTVLGEGKERTKRPRRSTARCRTCGISWPAPHPAPRARAQVPVRRVGWPRTTASSGSSTSCTSSAKSIPSSRAGRHARRADAGEPACSEGDGCRRPAMRLPRPTSRRLRRTRSGMSLHSSPPAELIAAIHRGQRFYVTSHQRPDGDAIGSAVAWRSPCSRSASRRRW